VGAGAPFLTRPALAVKIENTPDSRPQAGLEQADIVFEEVVEGGITRFMAIFQSHDAAQLGPVRSARPEDPDILRQFNAILAFSGAAQYVVQRIQDTPNVYMLSPTQAASAFHRVNFRPSPHNLYSSTQALYRAAPGRADAPPQPPWHFAATAPVPSPRPSGESPSPAPIVERSRSVAIDFSTSEYRAVWRYSATLGAFLRFEGGTPQMSDQVQLRAANVLVMYVRTRQSQHRDAAGHTTPIAEVTGGGQALLFRNGVEVVGRWSRRSLQDRTGFATTIGTPFEFAPGVTWVELVPIGIKVTVR